MQLLRLRRQQLLPDTGAGGVTLSAYIEGIGLYGPGLEGWDAARAALDGAAPYVFAETVVPDSGLLPPAERRRTTPTVKLALAAGAAAVKQAGREAASLANVFTSSGGDGETVHNILETLATAEREVSPTRFHNSVHNAPSGYWNIATKSREPSASLCAYDHSFIAGLVDALAQAEGDGRPVLLVSYDLPYPQPMTHIRPILGCFGVALLLSPAPNEAGFARLSLREAGDEPVTVMADEGLEKLRLGNPSARSLPVLAALARGGGAAVVLETLTGRIVVAVENL